MDEAKSLQKKPGGALSPGQAASSRLRGDIDAANAAGMDLGDWRIKQQLEARGLSWTRDNYIEQKWLGELPEEWDEGELPEDLQDWSKGGP
jgi:hypothetical protein